MKQRFQDLHYTRPNFTKLEVEFRALTAEFVQATCADKQYEILQIINKKRNEFSSLASLAHIRYTLNTQDPFYSAEQDYFDETKPCYEELITEYYRALVSSPHKMELSSRIGEQLFILAQMSLAAFSPAIITQLQQENRLISRYKKLLASAAIVFDGQERNLSQLVPYQQSANRAIRQAAHEARYLFFSENQEEFDDIFAQLVQVRTDIAHTLGFSDFTLLGYLRRSRSDYDENHVAAFRREVERSVVPAATQMRTAQRQRLGLSQLKYYDEALFFAQGNPLPQGSPEAAINSGQKMYEELSVQTGVFFQELVDRELMDLLSRKAKAPGGYCDFLAAYKATFIFANFNGTSQDVDVLTHEAGHAFQVWLCQDLDVPEYHFATMDAAEISSMGMEFFAWPWMEKFFGNQAVNYRYQHLSEAFLFLPYGALVDHFQHEVYATPSLTPTERRSLWRTLEKRYLPHRDYDDHPFLEAGGYWLQQGHIFEVPFYYIDYVLAQTCVLLLWQRAQTDRKKAWHNYLSLCQAGGSLPFIQLLARADLGSPFSAETVANVAMAVTTWVQNPRNIPR